MKHYILPYVLHPNNLIFSDTIKSNIQPSIDMDYYIIGIAFKEIRSGTIVNFAFYTYVKLGR